MKLLTGEVVADTAMVDQSVVELAQQFLSAPYLWGGVSPFGFDCSGLIQTIYRCCGALLPRDSKDQAYQGQSVDFAEIKPGDLIFFPGHVALSCGGREIIHASRKAGMVAQESLDSSSPRYRSDLAESITAVRRIIGG
jgi:cell wall-associated NlpC family hydrolase